MVFFHFWDMNWISTIDNFSSLITLTPRFFLRIQLKLLNIYPGLGIFLLFPIASLLRCWRQYKRHYHMRHSRSSLGTKNRIINEVIHDVWGGAEVK